MSKPVVLILVALGAAMALFFYLQGKAAAQGKPFVSPFFGSGMAGGPTNGVLTTGLPVGWGAGVGRGPVNSYPGGSVQIIGVTPGFIY
jgi:hypothetical protein